MKSHYTNPITNITREDVETLIKLAIQEDAPEGDITSEAIFDSNQLSTANVIAKSEGIFCGKKITQHLIYIFNQETNFHIQLIDSLEDGTIFGEKNILMKIKGETAGILRIERILLNFVQYLSGISTITYQIVQLAKEINPTLNILDTRKTIPGFRKLVKYAVYCGGGSNHRIHLSDMAMIKDNHIKAAKSISEAVRKIRQKYPHKRIEVEIESIHQIEEAILSKIDILLLDNMNIEQIKECLSKIDEICKKYEIQKPKIEISGGWKPENLKELTEINNVGISMGFLTHSVKFLDISMEIIEADNQISHQQQA